MAYTPEQIEAKALEIFETRQANLRRRIGVSFVPGRFTSDERAFCMAGAVERLDREAEAREQTQAIIDSMAHLSSADLRRVLASIEGRRNQPMYFIATNSRDVDRDYADMAKYRAELSRRADGLHTMMQAAE